MKTFTTSISLITFTAILSVSLAATSETNIIFPPLSEGLVPLTSEIMATSYFLSTFAATAANADWYCRQSNRRLLSIETDTEQDEIQRFLESNKNVDCVWTSGTDIASEGSWVWGNGSPLLYENFLAGQREDRSKNCLRLLGYNYESRYQWIKDNCDDKFRFICESVQ